MLDEERPREGEEQEGQDPSEESLLSRLRNEERPRVGQEEGGQDEAQARAEAEAAAHAGGDAHERSAQAQRQYAEGIERVTEGREDTPGKSLREWGEHGRSFADEIEEGRDKDDEGSDRIKSDDVR